MSLLANCYDSQSEFTDIFFHGKTKQILNRNQIEPKMKPIEKKGYLHSGITNIGIVNRKSNAIVLKGSNVALFAVKLATSFVSKYSVDTLFDRLMTACVTIDRINWQTLTHTFSLRNRLFVQNLTNTEKNQRSVFIRI